jgi:hypothetical protein
MQVIRSVSVVYPTVIFDDVSVKLPKSVQYFLIFGISYYRTGTRSRLGFFETSFMPTHLHLRSPGMYPTTVTMLAFFVGLLAAFASGPSARMLTLAIVYAFA